MESDWTEWSSGIGSAVCPTSVQSKRFQEAADPFSPCYLKANIKMTITTQVINRTQLLNWKCTS